MGEQRYDVVVVGGGTAGLSAALMLGRARRRVVVVDAGAPRNAPAAHMHGYLSRDGMTPAAFLAAGRAEVAGYGVELVEDRVVAIEPGFAVRLAGGAVLRARQILVATGAGDELPDLPGVWERWGKDLLHCPYCHGYEVRDQPLGVLETGAGAVEHALLIRQWTRDLIYFSHTGTVSDEDRARLAARDIRVVEGKVARLVLTPESDRLAGIELVDGRVVPRVAVFVRPGNVPHDRLLRALGCRIADSGWVEVDAMGRTSVPGVWAAGNVVLPWAGVVISAGQAAAAAMAINASLVNEDVERALAGR
jgi:thioredoxin reductase